MGNVADSRRIHLLESLAAGEENRDLNELCETLKCDIRTLRRDLDYLLQLLHSVQGMELRRGKVVMSRSGYSPGYFTDQLERNAAAKEAIARAVLGMLPDDMAVALTAGSTPYAVAREMRRAAIEGLPPHNLIVFTNSVPALQELIAASIPAGTLGDIYVPEDCAFHSPEFRSAFQPGVAIVGASGILLETGVSGGLELYSHRAEEAAFMKQLLDRVPEVIIVADQTKLGRRHPWSFGGATLHQKTVRLVTDTLTEAQREALNALAARLARHGTRFSFAAIEDKE